MSLWPQQWSKEGLTQVIEIFRKAKETSMSKKAKEQDDHCTECDGNGYHTDDCPNAKKVKP